MKTVALCFDMKDNIYAIGASTNIANDFNKNVTSHGSYAEQL